MSINELHRLDYDPSESDELGWELYSWFSGFCG